MDWFEKHFGKLFAVGIVLGLVFLALIGWGIIELIGFLGRH